MTKVIFSRRFLLHLDSIYNYIARDDPGAARSVLRRIYEAAENIEAFPEMGRMTVVRDIRMFPVTPYPYVLYFRLVPKRDEIRMLAVRHAARGNRMALHEEAAEFRR